MQSLKKFGKIFLKYNNHNFASAPEVWSDPLKDFYNSPSVDTYSYGILLWELETGLIPFEGLDEKAIKMLLLEQRLRPQIPADSDKTLTLLIRRCW
jgi:serine/threonine protein kinase